MKLHEVIKYAEKKDRNHLAGKSFSYQVKVKHSDGSIFKLKHAKTEILEMHLIVYTEHNGIQYFHGENIIYAKSAKVSKKTLKRGMYKMLINNYEPESW